MSLVEKLKRERLEKIYNHAINFVEHVEPEIIKSAQDGYTAQSIN